MYRFFLVLAFGVILFAQERIEVTAMKMEALEKEKKVVFITDVRLEEGKSWLECDKLTVYFDDNNETERFEASTNVRFEVIDQKSHYKGQSEHLIYDTKQEKYHLKGNAWLRDLIGKRFIAGEEIRLDLRSGDAYASSRSKKPVKVIFDVEKKR